MNVQFYCCGCGDDFGLGWLYAHAVLLGNLVELCMGFPSPFVGDGIISVCVCVCLYFNGRTFGLLLKFCLALICFYGLIR